MSVLFHLHQDKTVVSLPRLIMTDLHQSILETLLSIKEVFPRKKQTGVEECSRRITPTCLNQISFNNSFRESSNSFNDFNVSEVEAEKSIDSRNILVKECLNILSKKESIEYPQLPNKAIEICSREALLIQPDIDYVTYKSELNNVADLYIIILKNNFVLNITSEIYFLIFLLLEKCFMTDKESDYYHACSTTTEDNCNVTNHTRDSIRDFFKSIHNIVYFAARCLESQIGILKYFDKSTLKLLTFNKRLKSFAPKVVDKLKNIADEKAERTIEILDDNIKTNVCFNFETDNRNNFPNDSTFHAFKKQRDMFYEILSIWEHNHLQPNWSFSVGLNGKVKALFSVHMDPVNVMHFARLFKAHLISTCGRSQNVSLF